MARVQFTDGKAGSIHRKLDAGEVLWDTVQPGLHIRGGKRGRAYWVITRVDGKGPQLRRRVGEVEDKDKARKVGDIALPDARAEARRIISEAKRGIHPDAAALAAKAAAATAAKAEALAKASTFQSVARAYLDDQLRGGGANLASRPELERKLKTDLEPWHATPITEIRGRDIRDLIRAKAQTSPVAANRLLSFVKRVFRWAATQDYVDADPAAGIAKPGDEESRDRYLDEREIPLIWRACVALDQAPEDEPEAEGVAGRLYQLALVTGQRRGEVAGLRRSELGKLTYKAAGSKTVEGEAWLLPAERTKRGVAHTVPLSPLARKLIDRAPKRSTADGKAFDHLLTSGARGDQPISGWSKYKAKLDELVGKEIAKAAGEEYDPEAHALPAWHVHDLRATVATMLETRLDVPRPVVSRILNHAEADGRSMTSRYVRHTWDAEAADALNRWAEFLEKLCGLNVTPLPKRREGDVA